MDAAELLRQAGRIVREAGARLEDRSLAAQVRAKGSTDFVTAVDTEVQEQIRARLQALDGTIQFMAEEKDNAAIDPARPVWVLDPVDGTTNLIHGFRHSAISLALAEGGRVCLGLVFDPFAGELFAARRGGGSVLQRPAHPCQRGRVPGGQPLLGGDQSRPAGGSRRHLCPGPPHLRPLPRHPPDRCSFHRVVLYGLRPSGCIHGTRP